MRPGVDMRPKEEIVSEVQNKGLSNADQVFVELMTDIREVLIDIHAALVGLLLTAGNDKQPKGP